MAGVKKKKIVFVCTGNTCRSPMAEMLFRKLLNEKNIKNVTVASAGIKPTVGSPMNEKSAQTLMAKGIEALSFASKKVDKRTLKDAFAIVCMTDSQRDLLMEMRWQALKGTEDLEAIDNTVYSFKDLAGYEVFDPYGRDLDCYAYVYELIAGGMQKILDTLLPENIREIKISTKKHPKKCKNQSGVNEKQEIRE
jgi:protein-tyrosine phosphatase